MNTVLVEETINFDLLYRKLDGTLLPDSIKVLEVKEERTLDSIISLEEKYRDIRLSLINGLIDIETMYENQLNMGWKAYRANTIHDEETPVKRLVG